MVKKIFGTDGIRGRANEGNMTPEVALRLAMGIAARFKSKVSHGVVICKDTRLSGYMIQSALTAGFTSMGMDVIQISPLPTPAVAMLTHSLRADLGIMISASHNPYYDNGLKIFDGKGYKLPDSVEREIEALAADVSGLDRAHPKDLGRVRILDDAPGRYIEFAKRTFPSGMRLDGLKIVVDSANGAAYQVAPRVFWELGADVISICDQPDGLNINLDCGATVGKTLKDAVIKHRADLGIALDGDADRVLMVDEKGDFVDGDRVIAAIAQSWHSKGKLTGNGVVGTIMSNFAAQKYIESLGLEFVRSNVGDRYVVESMRKGGFNVGGEQSGHVILNDYVTTGDGIIAALQILAVLVEEQKPLSSMSELYEPMPQRLMNVQVENRSAVDAPQVQQAVTEAADQLGSRGRLVVRPSGTEPLIRVMAEAETMQEVDQAVDHVAQSIRTV